MVCNMLGIQKLVAHGTRIGTRDVHAMCKSSGRVIVQPRFTVNSY